MKNGQRQVKASAFGVSEMLGELCGRGSVPFAFQIQVNEMKGWINRRLEFESQAAWALFLDDLQPAILIRLKFIKVGDLAA